MKKKIYLLVGPSGSGKSTLIFGANTGGMKVPGLFTMWKDNFYYAVSDTTRPMRIGEKDGVDYNFLSSNEFRNKIASGQYIEHAFVFGNYYGLPFSEMLKGDSPVITAIDPEGAANVVRWGSERDDVQVMIIRFKIDANTCAKNMAETRTAEEAAQRIENDDIDRKFDEFNLKADCVISKNSPDIALRVAEWMKLRPSSFRARLDFKSGFSTSTYRVSIPASSSEEAAVVASKLIDAYPEAMDDLSSCEIFIAPFAF